MKYRFIKDLTSDVMYEAYGKTPNEVFENSAEALFDVICNREKITDENKVEIIAEAENLEDLMINWLQALIASVDIDEMFYKKFKVKEISDTRIVADCFGEEVSKEKGETVVKAVTYYNFEFEKNKDGYRTRVVLDI